MAWLLVGFGVGHLAVIAAAFSRLIDPGWPAFGAIGTLAGLVVAPRCLAVMTSVRSRHATAFRLVSLAAFGAGLFYCGARWSLLGTTFRLDPVGISTCQ